MTDPRAASGKRRRRTSSSQSSRRRSGWPRLSLSLDIGKVLPALISVGLGLGIVLALSLWIVGHWRVDQVASGGADNPAWNVDGASRDLALAKGDLMRDGPPDPRDGAGARQAAASAVAKSPLNVMALQYLAAAAAAEGDNAHSDAVLEFVRGRTERNAASQLARMMTDLRSEDYGAFAAVADAALRVNVLDGAKTATSPWDGVMQLLVATSDKEAVQARVAESLASNPTWSLAYLRLLATDGPITALPALTERWQAGAGMTLPSVEEARPARSGGQVAAGGTAYDFAAAWLLFLERFIAAGESRQAYALWSGLLPPERLERLGYLYNGDFGFEPSGLPFDWRLLPLRGVESVVLPDGGPAGRPALSVSFSGAPVPFQHVYQSLILEPGSYRLSGEVRTDNLQTTRGLAWRLVCFDADQSSVGAESERFSGTMDWTPFQVVFTIPPTGCSYQKLSLGIFARIPAERNIRGQSRFADLRIESLAAAPSNADAPLGIDDSEAPLGIDGSAAPTP